MGHHLIQLLRWSGSWLAAVALAAALLAASAFSLERGSGPPAGSSLGPATLLATRVMLAEPPGSVRADLARREAARSVDRVAPGLVAVLPSSAAGLVLVPVGLLLHGRDSGSPIKTASAAHARAPPGAQLF